MDRRFLTVLGVSLLFALVISSVFYQMTARAGAPKKAESTDLKDIILAARPLAVGTTIKPADIKLGKIPAAAFPKGAFGKAEEVIDRPVVSNILIDEAILDGRLATRGSGYGLAPIIPVGMRGVTVRVNDVTGISGFVLPGMRVDVLVTGHPVTADSTMTATALQNMLVLSAGTTVQADARGQAIQAATVTLLATPDQAETLTLANNEGRIQLVLRNGSDQTIEKTSGREIAELYGSRPSHKKSPDPAPRPVRRPAPPPVVTAVATAPPPPPPPPDQIVVIRGTQKSVETVSNGVK
ncbi:MAG TPA: Flp pilus assembly protein CpaB [Bryobacteraceae bacterium]|nr:Flp pilus assembly protein CpaB [Bryobacteraceae bacterium]